MTIVYPEGTPTLGNTKVTAVVAVAALAAPKLATEINAGTSVDISCFLMAGGWSPTGTTNKGTKAARLCSKAQIEQFNRTNYSFGALQYIYDPQAADSVTNNKAKQLLVEGTKIYLVERQGLDAQTAAWAVGALSVVHYVTLGPQLHAGDRTDENGEFYIMQEVIYNNAGPVYGIVAT